MNHDPFPVGHQLPPPCIIDIGIVPNKQDMQRLLADLDQVRYLNLQNGKIISQGEGYVQEVFCDPYRATLVANRNLYINVQSFDYLELGQSPEQDSYFDLVWDNRQLRLIPLSNPLQEKGGRTLKNAALEAAVADVLSAGWDAQIDDEDNFSF